MIRNCSFILALVVALSACAFSQTTPSATADPSPTPKPATKRRTFDQFDLSNGSRLISGSSTLDGYGTPTTVEQVDQGLFDTISQISESALFLEWELAKALEPKC